MSPKKPTKPNKAKKIKKAKAIKKVKKARAKIIKKALRVTKIMVRPSRTLPLGPHGYAKLSAGVEIELDTPSHPNSKLVKDAFELARSIVRDEFTLQYLPYKHLMPKQPKTISKDKPVAKTGKPKGGDVKNG